MYEYDKPLVIHTEETVEIECAKYNDPKYIVGDS